MLVPFGAWNRKVLRASPGRMSLVPWGIENLLFFFLPGEVEICQVSRVLLSSSDSLPLSWFLVFPSTSLNKEKTHRMKQFLLK